MIDDYETGFFTGLYRRINGLFSRGNLCHDSEIEESLDPDSPEKAKYNEYVQVAKFTDVDSPEFDVITQGIMQDRKTNANRTFATIFGPSLMGKTQFAFSLARKYKVFYVNFSGKQDQQEVYQAFDSMSSEIISILFDDCSVLGNKLESGVLGLKRNVKLKIIGFLWYLIEYSMEHDGNNMDWFDYYLKPRRFQYTSMSINGFFTKLKNLNQNFVPPIVFMDEFNTKEVKSMQLLRNICRILALPCVIASTNAKINTFSKDSASGDVWVYVIKKLPKANLKAIFHLLISKYTRKGEVNATNLIKGIGIRSDNTNKTRLDDMIKLLKQQSETCLQCVSLISFRGLMENLTEQAKKKQNLDAQEAWHYILAYLMDKLLFRKPAAFDIDKRFNGPYHSLAMISDESEIGPSDNNDVSTINNHFYYFGSEDNTKIVPLGYHSSHQRSHFKLFKDDLLLCMALWSNISMISECSSVASITQMYNKNLEDNRTVEWVVYRAICNSSHRKMGSITGGSEFVLRFIENLQVDQFACKKLRIEPFYLDFSVLPKLERFLETMEIPYLIPKTIITNDIEAQLEGICKFGNCERLSRGIEFEILKGKEIKTGFVSYIDKLKDLNTFEMCASEYLVNMLITSSLCDELKSQRIEPPQPKKTKLNASADVKMSIYSVFYEGRGMKIVPIREAEDPVSVLIIIETNFPLSKRKKKK